MEMKKNMEKMKSEKMLKNLKNLKKNENIIIDLKKN